MLVYCYCLFSEKQKGGIAVQHKEKPRRQLTPVWQKTLWGRLTVSLIPRQAVAGGVFTLLLLALTLWHAGSFLQDCPTYGGLLLGLSLAACLVLGALTVLRWQLPGRAGTVLSIVVFCLLPVVAMTMVECLNGVFTWDWSPDTLLLNYILYFLFYGLVYVFSGCLRLPMLIVNPLLFLLGLTNFYVMEFRGTPFVPLDLFSAGTAANVAVAYDFSFNYQVVISLLLLAFLQVAAYKLRTPRMELVGKVATRTFFGTLIVCIVGIYAFTDLYAEAGLKPDFWMQSRGYRNTGVVMNFCLNTKYLHFSKPSGYNAGDIERIVQEALDADAVDTSISTDADAPEEKPVILCIMNESLSDLQVLGDVQTNIDYMPFLRSLTENTVRGNLYVPVVGSGTSNTEFEFLTGLSTAFFPAGSNAYTLYIKDPLQSLVSTLGAQGYSRIAFHPYYPSGWNRIKVYKALGFQRFSSIGTALDAEVLQRYQSSGFDTKVLEQAAEEFYPGQTVLLRRYVSDSWDYKKVIEMYEQRDPDQPFFLFNVTMQNHGGYTEQAENFTQEVYVTDAAGQMAARAAASGLSGETVAAWPRVNQYLSLVKRSDDAFAELIDYFSRQTAPTVICMFGDHQPNVETDYIRRLLGVDSLYTMSTEQTLKQYITPFVIWANYDIPEQTIDKLSVNYLSSYLLQIAGLDMPTYNRYLLALSHQVPVITPVGYIGADGRCYANGQTSVYTPLLKGYEKVGYNLLFDKTGRVDHLYGLE